MKKKVLSLAALALFMISNLDAKEGNMVPNLDIEEENNECNVYAQDVFESYLAMGIYHGAAYEISEIAYVECTHGTCGYTTC